MIYLLDTNIIILNLQKKPLAYQIRDELGLSSDTNDVYLSVVSIGEIRSLGLQNKWGDTRLAALETYLSRFITLDINNVKDSLIGMRRSMHSVKTGWRASR
ncbi:type II toxin-antitoxin system VapC family toxin [Fibrella sp. WM1]|uniref:type II toxin-antitoxin system VapC family toxin n=1 Tax=Fibrella musci TaxID=3242485 RepID=UPI00351FF6C6